MKWYPSEEKDVKERELERGFITYDTLAKEVGSMILCNHMETRLYNQLELENGDDYDEETEEHYEIYQWYIITSRGAEVLRDTEALVYYDNELNVYVWGILHFGTSWRYVYTDLEVKK